MLLLFILMPGQITGSENAQRYGVKIRLPGVRIKRRESTTCTYLVCYQEGTFNKVITRYMEEFDS